MGYSWNKTQNTGFFEWDLMGYTMNITIWVGLKTGCIGAPKFGHLLELGADPSFQAQEVGIQWDVFLRDPIWRTLEKYGSNIWKTYGHMGNS